MCFWYVIEVSSEEGFGKLWGMVTHTETVKSVHVNMCLKRSCFRAVAILNFRTFKDNSLAFIS
jgi:hypothetical protein